MNMIRNFSELSKNDIPIAGGKGANLGELTNANMPVPRGFVITTATYDTFVKENGLGEIIAKHIQEQTNDGAAIRNAFEASEIPEDIQKAVLEGYKNLGAGAVAVRSSATAEDLPAAAFAGQQETYLNITNEKNVLEAVRRTWASLWTDRAISYRARLGIDQSKVKIAVVVQAMVDADFSGVLFTANPVTGNRKEIIVDTNPGLGEAIVSGMVTPDHYVVRRTWLGLRVTEKKEGLREVIVRSKKGGGTERIEKPNDTSQLPQKTLLELAKMGERIEKHFGAPQDIEWVWANGKISIVQSRPITALPDELPKQSKIGRLLAGTVAEMVPNRPYPLESTTLGFELIVEDFLRPFLKLFGIAIPPTNEVVIEEDGVPIRYSGTLRFRPTASVILTPFRLALYAIRYNPTYWKDDPLVTGTTAKIATLEAKNYKALSPRELTGHIQEVLSILPTIFEIRLRYLPRVALAIIGVRIPLVLVGKKDIFPTLLYSGLTTKVTQTNHALEGLAEKILTDTELVKIFKEYEAEHIALQLENSEVGKTFLREFYGFLDEYGYRETGGTMLISQPVWKESPHTVLGILKNSVNVPARPRPQEDWKDVRDTLIAQSFLRYNPFKSIFIKLLHTARRFHQIREDTRFYIMMSIPTLRGAILEFDSRLTELRLLSEPLEIFYLKFSELEQLVQSFPPQADTINEFKTIISRRKSKYEELRNVPFVDPRLYRTNKGSGNALLVGTPGSPGTVQGQARVIRDSSEFGKLRADDILIAPYTNPAWTPLFERASGVVVDTGGVMSHAAIVAREYGIPAVMGTVDGTTKIKDGDRINVDGTTGEVFLDD